MKPIIPKTVVYLLALSVFGLAFSCGSSISNASRYDLSNKIHVPAINNQSPATNIASPLYAAVKKRLKRVGIPVVDNTEKGALDLAIIIFQADYQPGNAGEVRGNDVGMDANITEVIVRLVTADGKVIAGPERFQVKENIIVGAKAFTPNVTHEGEMMSLSSAGDSFRLSEVDAEVTRLARAIVQHFFRKRK